jgi:hypothetical protein
MKYCIKCRTDKQESEFHKDKRRKDFLFPYCKQCRSPFSEGGKIHKYPYLPKYDNRYYRFRGQYYHRYLVEKNIGRKLTKYEVVHHINGNKHDNRIENLEIVKDKIHRSEHTKKWYEKNNFRDYTRYYGCNCHICKKQFIAKNIIAKYCSNRCFNASRKEYLREWHRRKREKNLTLFPYRCIIDT